MKPGAAGSTGAVIEAGAVKYAGAQRNIFTTGRAEATVSVAEMAQGPACFGLGAAAGLDGEITVLAGKPFVAKVRGDACAVDHGLEHRAAFAVWTEQANWRDESVPATVVGYLDLQEFVKVRAAAAGMDVTKPFPFRLVGTPKEVKWHINVDRTEGKPITPELFARSKARYVANNQSMEIIGFYSEHHAGVFVGASVPAIEPDSAVKNAIHIHFVARDGTATGHIDDLILGGDMRLFLPG